MRRRYSLRRSDNYPVTATGAQNVSGNGTFKVSVDFPVTSAMVAHAGALGSTGVSTRSVLIEDYANLVEERFVHRFAPTETTILQQIELHFSRHGTLRDYSIETNVDNNIVTLLNQTNDTTKDVIYAETLVLNPGDMITVRAQIADIFLSSSSSSESSSSTSSSSVSSSSSSSTSSSSSSTFGLSTSSFSSSSSITISTSSESSISSSSSSSSTQQTRSSSSQSSLISSESSESSESSSLTSTTMTSESSSISSSSMSSISSFSTTSSSSKSSASSVSSSSPSSESSPSTGLTSSVSSQSSSSISSSSSLAPKSSSSQSSKGSSLSSQSSSFSSISSSSSLSSLSSSSSSSLGSFRVNMDFYHLPVSIILDTVTSSSDDLETTGVLLEVTEYLNDGFVVTYQNAPLDTVLYYSYICI